jgi:hypothetical protein
MGAFSLPVGRRVKIIDLPKESHHVKKHLGTER